MVWHQMMLGTVIAALPVIEASAYTAYVSNEKGNNEMTIRVIILTGFVFLISPAEAWLQSCKPSTGGSALGSGRTEGSGKILLW